LHIAVSTSAPLSVVEYLLQDNPWTVIVCDVYNLTPLDWLWICHVREWPALVQRQHRTGAPNLRDDGAVPIRNPAQFQFRRLISGRRHVPRLLLDLHKLASAHVPDFAAPSSSSATSQRPVSDHEPNQGNRRTVAGATLPESVPHTNIHPELIIRHQDELLCRMKVLVIAAAEAYADMESASVDQTGNAATTERHVWSLLHAVCYVPCPRAMVRLVVLQQQSQQQYGDSAQRQLSGWVEQPRDPQLRCRDTRAGRLPLHYAAGRVGYTATFSTGFSGTVQVIQESSPVFDIAPLFPEACRVSDTAGEQLPLHVAIDAFKHHRVVTLEDSPVLSHSRLPTTSSDDADNEEDKVLGLLLDFYPGGLDRRDGKTKLYPWMQAAAGCDSRLSTIYSLLRLNPALCLARNSHSVQAKEGN
jgi:hypothetical protein